MHRRSLLWLCWIFVMGAGGWASSAAAVDPNINMNKAMLEARERLVRDEIVAAGIKNRRVIDSMLHTPRHEFMPVKERKNAYFDMALPIGEKQTISPPFVVAFMTESLDPQPEDRVLEIGTGSGFQAAILSPLVKDVYTIEIVEPLGKRAAETLRRLEYKNVHCKIGDGYLGWAEHAPFDKIIVTCSPEDVPKPLVEQLREGGRMVIPLGERYQQALYLFTKKDGELVKEALLPTMFVPMTGEAEDNRAVKPDPANPRLANSGFEDYIAASGKPLVWYYVRQGEVKKMDDAPEGSHCVTFKNSQPGLDARALQAFPIDGRKVKRIRLSAWTKGQGIQRGKSQQDLPAVAIMFYDNNRKGIDKTISLGGWTGTFDWQQTEKSFDVPVEAREAIVRLGLLGAVGEISFDQVEVQLSAPR